MRFTLRCVRCMATSVLRDQQYMFGVRSLLVAEKALLIRNDLAGMSLRRPMPRLPQLILSYGPTGACQFQTLFGTPVFHEIQCTESSANHLKFRKVSARQVPKQLKSEQQAIRMMTSLDNLQRYKTEGEVMPERIATRQKGRRCWRGLLQDRRGGNAGEDCYKTEGEVMLERIATRQKGRQCWRGL